MIVKFASQVLFRAETSSGAVSDAHQRLLPKCTEQVREEPRIEQESTQIHSIFQAHVRYCSFTIMAVLNLMSRDITLLGSCWHLSRVMT